MVEITPEICKHLDLLCTECPDRMTCEPLARELRDLHWGGTVDITDSEPLVLAQGHGEAVLPRHMIPDFLKGASKSVRKSYGYQ